MTTMIPGMEIDRLSQADSIVTLLGRLNVERFPPAERMAVARLQVEAIDEWLSAYLEDVTSGPVSAATGSGRRSH